MQSIYNRTSYPLMNEQTVWANPVYVEGFAEEDVPAPEERPESRSDMTTVATEIDIVGCEGTFCGIFGYINFTQVGDMLGEPAPAVPRPSRLRFSFHYRSDGGRIAEGYAMFDLPALFAQWGIDLYARAGGGAEWV